MSKESAFDWLWGTTLINLGLGALLWVINTVALDNNDFDSSSDQVNSLLWQGIGSGLWGFGVLVFVITLATSAVVGAIDGNSTRPEKQAEARVSPDTKFEASSQGKSNSLKKWLDEDKK